MLEMIDVANYSLTVLADCIRNIIKQHTHRFVGYLAWQWAGRSTMQFPVSQERVRTLLEKHRLMFLYFAVPKQINPLATRNKWQPDSLKPDQFPKFRHNYSLERPRIC